MPVFVLNTFLRYLVVLFIGFLAAKRVIGHDVEQKLYAGDTVALWDGSINLNIRMVVDFILLSIIPALAPTLLGLWVGFKTRYKILIARLSGETLSHGEVNAAAKGATKMQIIKAVAGDHRKK